MYSPNPLLFLKRNCHGLLFQKLSEESANSISVLVAATTYVSSIKAVRRETKPQGLQRQQLPVVCVPVYSQVVCFQHWMVHDEWFMMSEKGKDFKSHRSAQLLSSCYNFSPLPLGTPWFPELDLWAFLLFLQSFGNYLYFWFPENPVTKTSKCSYEKESLKDHPVMAASKQQSRTAWEK